MNRYMGGRVGLAVAAGFVALVQATSCASTPDGDFVGVERWRVVNPSMVPPQPVGEAIVLLTYNGTAISPGHSASICDRALLVKADQDGWFDVPITRERREVRKSAHKANHAAPKGYSVDGKVKQVYLIPNPTYEQRIRHFGFLRGEAGCGQVGASGQAISDFAEMVIPEMRSLVKTEEDRRLLSGLEATRDIYRARPQ